MANIAHEPKLLSGLLRSVGLSSIGFIHTVRSTTMKLNARRYLNANRVEMVQITMVVLAQLEFQITGA